VAKLERSDVGLPMELNWKLCRIQSDNAGSVRILGKVRIFDDDPKTVKIGMDKIMVLK
jgi:hypothetical protein